MSLGVHGVEGDSASGEVEALEVTHDGDLVGPDLFLSQDQAGAMFHRRDHHPAPVLGLLRGAAQVFAVHGHRGVSGAVLAGPLADGVVESLWRKRREDIVEGGDRGRGVALLALAVERAHGLELVLQAGELGKRGDAAVPGQAGRDGERQRVQRLPPGEAALGTSPRHSNRLRRRGAAIGSVRGSPYHCAGVSARLSASAALAVSSNTKISLGWP